jgi:glycopeptide antibiotics resistance protein
VGKKPNVLFVRLALFSLVGNLLIAIPFGFLFARFGQVDAPL